MNSTGWLPATPEGKEAGYAEGNHFTHEGRSLDAVVWAQGQVSVVGVVSCGSKADAERYCAKYLSNPNPLERDRTIPFKDYFKEKA